MHAASICAACDQPNPDGALACVRCASILPPPPPDRPGAPPAAVLTVVETHASPLADGPDLGPRYHIVRLLGRGGMGAVYLARDGELGREVALKVIAPHLASEPWVIERFKREIHLSTIVTHPNVLRVYDLGEHGGTRFLTMQYIEGETIAELLRRERPLPIDRAVELFREICAALRAAHEKGVLHRDLKPQNVLVDHAGTAYLTDFGLATSAALASLTQTGALMGTPHYMSPEQVKGAPLDARSDVFAAGVMLYEMLAGELPYAGESSFDVMMARTRAPPRPVSSLNAAIPKHLQRLVERCMAIDPAGRYGSVAELLADLDAGVVRGARRRDRPRLRVPLRSAAVAGALALLTVAPFAAWRLWPAPAAPPKAQTLLVADFDNRTGEEVFNGTLEPALATALEGASFLASYNRGSALRLAERLELEGSGLPERRARLVAQREGIGVVTSGFVEREGSGYRVGLRAVDAFTGQRLFEDALEVRRKDDALAASTALAARLRRVLGDVTTEAVLLEEGETFSAASLEAAHEYARANELALSQGKYGEAKEHYLAAIRLDPAMARAYSGLAVIEANGGRHQEAEGHFQQAMVHAERMTEREKQRTRGLWFFIRRDTDKAIEAFEALVRQYPSDNAGLANLALAYSLKGDFPRAWDLSRKAVAIYPRNVPQRSNVGYFAMYSGSFEEAIAEQQRALAQNSRFVAAHVGLALAQLAAGRRDEAIASWRSLEALGAQEASTAAEGLADLALYEGRLSDARALLQAGVAADAAAPEAAARKAVMLGEAFLRAGDAARAADAAEQALRSTAVDFVRFQAALVLAEAGRHKRAQALADELENRIEALPRMYAELIRGAGHLRRREYVEAIARFRSGVQRQDTWLARYALGRAYVEAGAYPQANDELDTCERRRGEVTDLFIESVPTYRLYPAVQYYQGRAREGLGDAAAAKAYAAFLAIKRSDEEPLVRDARARLERLPPASAPPPR